MRNQVVFTVLTFLTLLYLAHAQTFPAERSTCRRFYEECDFEFLGFEGRVPRFPVGGPPDVPMTTRIVSKDPTETLGVLNTNGIVPEAISFEGEAFPITLFGNPPFTPTHAKPYALPEGGSGVGYQTFTGNQLRMTLGECLRVFFTSYQVLVGPDSQVVRNVNARKEDMKCVVFFTK